MTPGRPAAASPASRTRAADAHRSSRSEPRACRAISASTASSATPSRARRSTRRTALALGGGLGAGSLTGAGDSWDAESGRWTGRGRSWVDTVAPGVRGGSGRAGFAELLGRRPDAGHPATHGAPAAPPDCLRSAAHAPARRRRPVHSAGDDMIRRAPAIRLRPGRRVTPSLSFLADPSRLQQTGRCPPEPPTDEPFERASPPHRPLWGDRPGCDHGRRHALLA